MRIYRMQQMADRKSLRTGNIVVKQRGMLLMSSIVKRMPPRGLTAVLMGDPLPGRSALDRMDNRTAP